MRFTTRTTLFLLTMGMVLAACSKDQVMPSDNSGTPSLSGSMGDYHPAFEDVCQTEDTLFLQRADGVAPTVDRCFGMYGEIQCAPNQPRWGFVEMQSTLEVTEVIIRVAETGPATMGIRFTEAT